MTMPILKRQFGVLRPYIPVVRRIRIKESKVKNGMKQEKEQDQKDCRKNTTNSDKM
jgi:hypothetical protein